MDMALKSMVFSKRRPPRRDIQIAVTAWCTMLVSSLAGCGPASTAGLFQFLDGERTGIDFINLVEGDSTFNILNYPYFYDGGGIAAGDVNHDGLVDLYFTASEGPNRLYLNRGNLRFEDVTDAAGVAGSADWTKGVTMADVNGDGLLDIYVSNVDILSRRGSNELFINRGDGSFSEEAATYGLDFSGYATQASFFDYDADGDLDVYLVNHSVHAEATHGPDTLRYERHPRAGDRLLRNDNGRFVDVSAAAGIYGGRIGYGLAVAVSDLDVDGCPDLWVSNDFHEHDYVYFNRCDGTFEETIRSSVGHASRSSMGNDTGDIDNDGLPDVIVLDMLPARQDILNSSANFERIDLYERKLGFGYHHQEIRNTLQWNRGARRFSEIAYLAEVYATDWSWASLFADFDNNGFQDLFVTNGIYRRPNDRDFSAMVAQPPMLRRIGVSRGPSDEELLAAMPSIAMPNYMFRNRKDLRFEDVTSKWGLDQPGFSNGAVYADLDNDGDLDLVINNVNEPASIVENLATDGRDAHYVEIDLRGTGQNTYGVGARVTVQAGDLQQVREQIPTRGWQSSVPPRLHFGLGDATRIDTILVLWPDRTSQVITDISSDTLLTIDQRESGATSAPPGKRPAPLFVDRTDEITIPYRHRENVFIDFSREGLMPRKVSVEGPALAVGDVDGDGLEDIFGGGAKWQAASLLLQRTDGTFARSDEIVWAADSLFEDVDAAFFDADGDNDLDLYVASAGNEFSGDNPALQDRLYLNNGDGHFTRSVERLPSMPTNTCCVAPADYDGDGDIDLFVGGRVVPREYGASPRSYLLRNDGSGFFEDVTELSSPDLVHAGLVTASVWADLMGDSRPELVIAGDWMPVRVFTWASGKFEERTSRAGLETTSGLWSAMLADDVDSDGDTDLVLGNLGLNSLLRSTSQRPLRLLIGDIDADGRQEHFVTTTRLGEEYLVVSPDELVIQVPSLTRKYREYKNFGAIRLRDVTADARTTSFLSFQAQILTTSFAENNGDGRFTIRELPIDAQIAPVHAVAAVDIDADGRTEIILAGNSERPRRIEGRLDASYGTLIRFDEQLGVESLPPHESGLYLIGSINGLALVKSATRGPMLVAARNHERLQIFELAGPR